MKTERHYPEFLKEFPSGIYKTVILDLFFKGDKLPEQEKERFQEDLSYLVSNPEEGYISNTDEFFHRWINQRRGDEPSLPQPKHRQGFELQWPQIIIKTLEDEKKIGSLKGLVLASDFGYSGDFRDNLVFAINHLPSERVLVYRDEHSKQIMKKPFKRKNLIETGIYSFHEGPEKFPFESLNPLKSDYVTYTLLGIQPEQVYSALRKIGFHWRDGD